MKYVVFQRESTVEVRAAMEAVILADLPKPKIYRASIEDLKDMGDILRSDEVLPVGSVEFVHEFMDVAGIARPEPLSYPEKLRRFLQRHIVQTTAGEVQGFCFVKPVATKLFDGFIYEPMADEKSMDAHTRENHDIFVRLDPKEPVWVSEIIDIASEYRFYIHGKRIVGSARYDQSDMSYPWTPDLPTVKSMIYTLGLDHPYCLDVGISKQGETFLIEANDAYAIGYYREAMASSIYLEFLRDRWKSIVAASRAAAAPVSQF